MFFKPMASIKSISASRIAEGFGLKSTNQNGDNSFRQNRVTVCGENDFVIVFSPCNHTF
jgi:hypothetical protein